MSAAAEYRALRQGLTRVSQPCMISQESVALWCYLADVQRRHGIGGQFLEIGAFEGHAAAVMAKLATPAEKVTLLDIELREAAIAASRVHIAGPHAAPFELVAGDSRVIARRGQLRERYGTFRWIHVDGEHSYDAVMSDLELAADALSPGGLIVVDDFFNVASACVSHALFTFLDQNPHRARMFLCGFNKAYLAAPKHLGTYRDACDQALIAFLEGVGVEATLSENAFSTELDYRSVLARQRGVVHRGIGFMREAF